MDAKYYVIFLIVMIVNNFFWCWYGRRSLLKRRDGIFKVNTLNPEKDVFRLEIECPLGAIPTKKHLIFEVVNEASQEKPLV